MIALGLYICERELNLYDVDECRRLWTEMGTNALSYYPFKVLPKKTPVYVVRGLEICEWRGNLPHEYYDILVLHEERVYSVVTYDPRQYNIEMFLEPVVTE